jgi:hypothetical protein
VGSAISLHRLEGFFVLILPRDRLIEGSHVEGTGLRVPEGHILSPLSPLRGHYDQGYSRPKIGSLEQRYGETQG